MNLSGQRHLASGVYYHAGRVNATALAAQNVTTGRVYALPILNGGRAFRTLKVGFYKSAGASTGISFRAALYRRVGMYDFRPGKIVARVTIGSLGVAPSFSDATFECNLAPGEIYWLAFLARDTTGAGSTPELHHLTPDCLLPIAGFAPATGLAGVGYYYDDAATDAVLPDFWPVASATVLTGNVPALAYSGQRV